MQFYVAEGREEYILCYHSETIIYPLIFMCMFFFSVQCFMISYNWKIFVSISQLIITFIYTLPSHFIIHLFLKIPFILYITMSATITSVESIGNDALYTVRRCAMEETLFILCSFWVVLLQFLFLHFILLKKGGILDPLNLQETNRKKLRRIIKKITHPHFFQWVIKTKLHDC